MAIGLIFGRLAPDDFGDAFAADPRIDALRAKMVVREDRRYTRDYANNDVRSNANAIRVHFSDGTSTERVEITYPMGHRRRRKEGFPHVVAKFDRYISRVYADKRRRQIRELCLDFPRLAATPVNEFFDLLVT